MSAVVARPEPDASLFSTPPRRTLDPVSVARELDAKLNSQFGSQTGHAPRRRSLRVVTWNLWFDKRSQMRRCQAALLELFAQQPDVICLQEVTADVLEVITSSAWIMESYAVDADHLDHDHWYDVAMLVKKDLSPVWWDIPLESLMGRRCLVADIMLGSGLGCRIATVHLESRQENERYRAVQLKQILEGCQGRPGIFEDGPNGALKVAALRGVLLCGDLNMCSSWPENNFLATSCFCDLWPLLQPGDRGHTVDTSSNGMLWDSLHGAGVKQVRFDRILLAMPSSADGTYEWFCQPLAIRRLGTQPLTEVLWCSDHYGLSAEVGLAYGPQHQVA